MNVHSTSVRRRTVLAAAATLVVASCGGEDAAADGESLEDFFGVGMGAEDPAAQEAELAEQQRQVEEAVAACMAEEGFEYTPRELDFGGGSSHPSQELDEDEFREQYGYGISTVTMDDEVMEPTEDPDADRLAQMDPAEQEAYELALHGEPPEPDPDDPEAPLTWEMGGCRGEAEDELFGDRQEVWEDLGELMQDLHERVEADPRVTEARAGWSSCMADAGHAFSEQEEIWQHLSEQMNELYMGASEPDWEAMDEDDLESWQPEPDPAGLEQLQDEELAIAAADEDCAEEHLGVEEEVRAELEADFIAEHRDLLEDARDVM